jgi:uncharacterized protein YfiM (DUF2279 family)
MIKRILFCLLFSALLCAANDESDTSVTRIPVSAVKLYSIKDDTRENELPASYRDPASERPFALRQPEDHWFSKDKWMHLSASYFIVIQSRFVLEKNFRFSVPEANNISYGLSLSLSLGKEFYDVFGNNGIFSWKDLVYDLIGSGLGYLTVKALE